MPKTSHRDTSEILEYLDTDGELRSAYEAYVEAYSDDPYSIYTKAKRERYLSRLDQSLFKARESEVEREEVSCVG